MQKQGVFRASALAILLTLCLLPGIAHAANVAVNCPGASINAALASLDPSADNAIIVSGACSENVDIVGFDRLRLIAQNGASITDASGGAVSVVGIFESKHVTVQGFTINGNSPNAQDNLIDCNFSTCVFRGNTVQGGSGDGVDVFNGAHAFFVSDVFQDLGVGATGIFLGGGSVAIARDVTIQRVGGDGVEVAGASFLGIRDSTVENNADRGIAVGGNSTANIRHSTITGNAGDGIDVVSHSTLGLAGGALNGSSITGNHGVGILVKDLSFAGFPKGAPNVVKNNLGGTDVLCSPKFPVTRGALTDIGGGKTNCEEGDNQ